MISNKQKHASYYLTSNHLISLKLFVILRRFTPLK